MVIDKPQIYTVSRLNQQAAETLLEEFGTIWVEGEISNIVFHQSGHWYFSLKDPRSQIRCVMFRHLNGRVNFVPTEGMNVLVKSKVGVYQPRGDFQLTVEMVELAGVGDLQRAFLELQHKLDSEGLFAAERKRPLPKMPRSVGVITSPTGAAIHDILTVLKQRSPILPIIIYPSLVQGSTAADSIVKALQISNERCECDVLILARGGGSLEDLWPFNEEKVARAIFQSTLPIVSAIGHEVDITIADLVADYRAPTPSAAAVAISPDRSDSLNYLAKLYQQLSQHVDNYFSYRYREVRAVGKRFIHTLTKLQNYEQRLDYLQNDLAASCEKLIVAKEAYLNEKTQVLDTLSPLATLSRGYAVVFQNKKVVDSIRNLKIEDKIEVRLKDGEAECRVQMIKK